MPWQGSSGLVLARSLEALEAVILGPYAGLASGRHRGYRQDPYRRQVPSPARKAVAKLAQFLCSWGRLFPRL